MIDNPFAILERRINRLETLLLEIKQVAAPLKSDQQDRCTLKDALSITGLSKSKIYKLTAANEIPHKRFGNRLIFSRKELRVWVDSQTVCKDNKSKVCLNLAATARRKINKG